MESFAKVYGDERLHQYVEPHDPVPWFLAFVAGMIIGSLLYWNFKY